MPRGVLSPGKVRAPRDPNKVRGNAALVARTKAAVQKQVGKLAAEVQQMSNEMQAKVSELKKARELLVALSAFDGSPTSVPAASQPNGTVAAGQRVVSALKTSDRAHPSPGPRMPGEPEAILQVVDYLRMRGNEVDRLPDGRFKVNGAWVTKSDMVKNANEIRRSRQEREFEFPNGV